MKTWLGIGIGVVVVVLAFWFALRDDGEAGYGAGSVASAPVAASPGPSTTTAEPSPSPAPASSPTASPTASPTRTTTATRTRTTTRTATPTTTSTANAVATATTIPPPPSTPPSPSTPTDPSAVLPESFDSASSGGYAQDGRSRGALSGAIAGLLRDARGKPLAGAAILAVASDGIDAGETVTDDDGFFLIAALQPGHYAVFAGLETALASRVGARGIDVVTGAVARLELRESSAGATIRIRALGPDGSAAAAQALLLSGAPREPGARGSVLASDAIYLPELGARGLVVPNVPPGVYTLVLLRGGLATPIAAAAPVRVSGERELSIDVRMPAADI